jgi:hypothetical protein
MTQSNLRGGLIKTLEINQDESNVSKTVLSDELLKKADNYVLQVTRFISNVTPNINTITERVFEVLKRPLPNSNILSVPAMVVNNLSDALRLFEPKNVKTALELVRQMMVFARQHAGLTITLNDNNTIRITLDQAFGSRYYIRVGPQTRKLLGLREYLYFFKYEDWHLDDVIATNDQPHPEVSIELFLVDAVGNFVVFQESALFVEGDVPSSYGYDSPNPVSCLDTRLSLDVHCSFPISTQPHIFNGEESTDYILGRFPTNDYIEHHVAYKGLDTYSVLETVNLGLEDLCRSNPNTVTNFFLPGEISVVNIKILTRYLEEQKIKTVNADYSNGGFFSLKLLFSKKQK